MTNQFRIETLSLGLLATNCYIIWNESQRDCLIIDPADSGDTISQLVLDHQLHPSAIILTHGHFDHVLGLLEVKLNFGSPILMHKDDTQLLKGAQKSAEHWLKLRTDPVPKAESFLSDGDQIEIGTLSLKVLHTPGHTPGSICLFADDEQLPYPILFSGDTLFAEGVGRTDFSYSKPLQLRDSLEKLLQLPATTRIFPGHGESTTIEKAQQLLT